VAWVDIFIEQMVEILESTKEAHSRMKYSMRVCMISEEYFET
jgi:hypothetical protein